MHFLILCEVLFHGDGTEELCTTEEVRVHGSPHALAVYAPALPSCSVLCLVSLEVLTLQVDHIKSPATHVLTDSGFPMVARVPMAVSTIESLLQ